MYACLIRALSASRSNTSSDCDHLGMDFDLSDEQRLLKESARRFVNERCTFDAWQRWRAAGQSPGEALWAEFAAMGWLQLPFAQEDGGFDAGPVETMLLVEELGRGLMAEPFLQSVVLTGELLRRSPASAQRSARIAQVGQGRCRVAVAHAESAARYRLDAVATQARRQGSTWRISGCKNVVLGAAKANALIVSAATDQGISLFWVDSQTQGVALHAYPTVDGVGGADIRFVDVAVSDSALVGELGQGVELMHAAGARALAAMGAEAVGLMDLLLEQTVAYTSQRRQFGQPVARFQALRHRMVDMFMQAEQTCSLVYLATIRLLEDHPETAKALSALKVQIGKGGRFVSQQAVQLHGGMGMSDEIVVGHAFKRLLALDAQLGNVDHHLQRFASLSA